MAWVRKRIKESETLIDTFEKDEFGTDEHVHAGIGVYYFEESPRTRGRFQLAI